MGPVGIVLCIFVGHFVSVHSFPGFFDPPVPFPLERNFDFPPYHSIVSSWPAGSPDFHVLAELPPFTHVPGVQVFCDESQLSVLVDKRADGAALTAEDVQLGDGCYSNGERPHQYVFTYSVDECGTSHSFQNGLMMFTNNVHLNLKKPLSTWWQTPSTVQISCIPQRALARPRFSGSVAPAENGKSFSIKAENGKSFSIKAMKPSWTSAAESNVYKRGQAINLQVSAETGPERQLFIQSCSVSASPEPQSKPRRVVIMNKGCTAPLGSPHPVVQFVASRRGNMVNFALNTSYLISELYIHCSVHISDQGVNSGSKSCNYDIIQSRWEDLNGAVEVCECCSSKCEVPSVRHLPDDGRATVSTGPLVIVDKDIEMRSEPAVSEQQETRPASVIDSMLSDAPVTEDTIVSGASRSRSEFSSAPHGVVVVSRDPVARLTLWLPGKVQDTEHSNNIGSMSEDSLTVQLKANDVISNEFPDPQPSTSQMKPPTNEVEGQTINELKNDASLWDLNVPAMVDGWLIPGPPRQKGFGRSGVISTDVAQVDVPLPAEMAANDLNRIDFNQMGDELAQMQADAAVTTQGGTGDVQPVVRSKLQFSKGMDGTQTVSYEEEVVKQQEGKGAARRCGMDLVKRKLEPRQKGLRSAFLDLLRMDKAE
ncbi:zona pellucida protein C' isoform 2 [Scophthalmus maximus]|uniref:Zona pellucida protein C' isoform 2 n=1 Tax=Scophthalmus maximus TaxID=52904 RepID=A0A2U9CKK3_SCOMX|nr:zona pellucida protein C' isoform 2 [Scophthalmus maximus]